MNFWMTLITTGKILAGTNNRSFWFAEKRNALLSYPKKPYIPLVLGLFVFSSKILPFQTVYKNSNVLGATVVGSSNNYSQVPDALRNKIALETTSAFKQKSVVENKSIAYETKYEKDKELEYGEEKLKTQGVNGNIKTTYKVTYWFDDELYREKEKVEVTDPVTEVITKGTKIVWRLLPTSDAGRVKYWRKLRVWATKYDGNCVGCRGLTYSGTRVVKGVCAVDPKTIPLGTTFYVEGYGMCHAEDIGGGIKGNKIDLGFEDASKGAWGAAYTNVYLITSVPED